MRKVKTVTSGRTMSCHMAVDFTLIFHRKITAKSRAKDDLGIKSTIYNPKAEGSICKLLRTSTDEKIKAQKVKSVT